MQGSKHREWLIKSSGEIRGPYTFDEIAEGIATKEFRVVDEVSRKFNRWKYLRDEELFEKVILEQKNKEFSKGEKTFTNSETDPDPDTDTATEDLGNNVVSFAGKNSLISSIEEHLKVEEEDRQIQKVTETVNKKKEIVKNYAMESELNKKVPQSSSSMSYLVLLLVVTGIVGALFFNKKEKVLSYDDLKKIAYDNINYGNFDAAKIYLEKALAVNSTNEELKYLSSYVSMEIDDTISAQRLLTDLINTGTDKKLKSQALNLNGILQLKNFNLKEATKSFEDSLNINPKFPAAIFNLGVAEFLENKFDSSYKHFKESLENGGMDGNILLAMVEMFARQSTELKSNPVKHTQATEILNLLDRLSTIPNYRQELKIAYAYLAFVLGEKSEMEKGIEEAINIDPTLTADHVSDITYYKGIVTWDRISEWTKYMRDANNNIEDLRSFYGYALFKGSEKMKGKDIIEGLLKSNYSNTSNQIIQCYILMALNRNEEAKAALAPIMHLRDKSLPFIMMGKLCLAKNDYPCADLNFSEALRIDKNNITAQAGLADVYFEQKDYTKSEELMRDVYKISPTYIPILKVKQKIEKEKGE
jgi:tetratricopeptide (TPR) repeat protein